MRTRHSKEQGQFKKDQQENHKDRVDEKTQRNLLQSKELDYKPKDSRTGFVTKQDEMNMMKDFQDGKNTPAIIQNRERIQSAQHRAVVDVQKEQQRERSELSSDHEKAQDKFLVNAEKQRNFDENAKDVTQKSGQRDFTKSSDKESWKKAMDMAKQKENQHDRDDRNKDDRSR